MAEFDLAQIAKWLGCQEQVSGKVRGFKNCSVFMEPGDLLFAMKETVGYGHDFLEEIAAMGGAGAVVSYDYSGDDYGLPLLRVENVINALHKLAKTVHAQRSMRVIAVTGSSGKTTTKEFIASILESKFRVAKTPDNFNGQMDLSLTILNAKGDEEVLVAEMAMSLIGPLSAKVDIAPPEVAVLTKIGFAHSRSFADGLEGVARAKAEIFSHHATRVGIVNCQAASFSSVMTANCLKMTYGTDEEAMDCDFKICREGENYYAVEAGVRTPAFALSFSAPHLVENCIGAAAAARAFGMQWSEIIPRLSKLTPVPLRFERREHRGIVFINDCYSADPTSMKAALKNLPIPGPGKKRIGVIGIMKETNEGIYPEQSHREVALAALDAIDYLLCLGEESRVMVEVFESAGRPAEHFLDLEHLKKRVFELASEEDVVLLKASGFCKLWKILEE